MYNLSILAVSVKLSPKFVRILNPIINDQLLEIAKEVVRGEAWNLRRLRVVVAEARGKDRVQQGLLLSCTCCGLMKLYYFSTPKSIKLDLPLRPPK